MWRTQNAGGDRAFLEAHCNTAVGEFPSDLLYTGACGSPADWPPLGASTLTGDRVRRDEERQQPLLARAEQGRRDDVGRYAERAAS